MTTQQEYEKTFLLWLWLFQNPGRSRVESPFKWADSNYRRLICGESSFCRKKYKCGQVGNACFHGAFNSWLINKTNRKASAYIASNVRRIIKKHWPDSEVLK